MTDLTSLDPVPQCHWKRSQLGRPPLNLEKLEASLLVVKGGISPTKAARRTALGRSTLYREIRARDHA
jgi:hypothetical protein